MIGERTRDLRPIRASASPFLVRSCAHLPPRLAATDGLGDRAPLGSLWLARGAPEIYLAGTPMAQNTREIAEGMVVGGAGIEPATSAL